MCRSLSGLCSERCRCDTDFQKLCSLSYNVKCEDCEKPKSVLEEVRGAISNNNAIG